MTDINRLLASLKRRSAHAKEFGDSITFVKLKDIDALEKTQQLETKDAEMVIQISKRLAEAYKRVTELESRTVTVKLPDFRATYKGSFADEVEHQVRNALDAFSTATGIKWEAE